MTMSSDAALERRWDRMSRSYDWLSAAEHHRAARAKRSLFRRARGRVLLVGIGTGKDLELLPPGLDIVAIDVSRSMVEIARRRGASYQGRLDVRAMDVRRLGFAGSSFDVAIASFVFCSVPQPALGLCEIHRVLRPRGRLLMIEHVRSRFGPVAMMQDLFTVISRRIGPDMNRDTVGAVLRAGFRLLREENLYLDVLKAIVATRD
jgi:ubiquinone/menaquinone biosynthesis C-methylase UbiE